MRSLKRILKIQEKSTQFLSQEQKLFKRKIRSFGKQDTSSVKSAPKKKKKKEEKNSIG